MKTKFAMILLLGCIISLALPSIAQEGDIAVVVNSKNPVSNLTHTELRKIFAGEKKSWSNGVPVKLIVRGSGTPEQMALLKFLDMSESAYKQYWTAQVFRGEAQSEPVAMPSSGMTKEAIVALPGAISLISVHDVKAPEMKVVKIDGALPGDAEYPLH